MIKRRDGRNLTCYRSFILYKFVIGRTKEKQYAYVQYFTFFLVGGEEAIDLGNIKITSIFRVRISRLAERIW